MSPPHVHLASAKRRGTTLGSLPINVLQADLEDRQRRLVRFENVQVGGA